MTGIVRKINDVWMITWDAPDTGTTEPILHWEKPLSPESVKITESSIDKGYVFEGREVEFEKNKIDFNKATVWGIITTLLLMFFCKLIF